MILYRCHDIIEKIDDNINSIALETKGRLMTIEKKKGILVVNYNDDLPKLLKEIRQLASFGFAIPKKIIHCAKTAETFYKYAIVLKQVSTFLQIFSQNSFKKSGWCWLPNRPTQSSIQSLMIIPRHIINTANFTKKSEYFLY